MHRPGAGRQLLTVILALACDSSAGPAGGIDASADADAGAQFIATTGDFAGYLSWYHVLGTTSDIDGVHTAGQRVIFINRTPPHGSTSFPEGTIIVKTVPNGTTFAMAQRGGGFNSMGAVGWEWFELADHPNGDPTIVWRGASPPTGNGDPYSGSGNSCSNCHENAQANDYVQDSGLQLSSF